MAVKFITENKDHYYYVSIENYVLKMENSSTSYLIYFNKERSLNNIRSDIALIDDTSDIKLIALSLINLIRSNLIALNSKFNYENKIIEISRNRLRIFDYRLDNIVNVQDEFRFNDSYNWRELLLYLLYDLKKYIINTKELVTGHIVVRNNIIKENTVVRVRNKLQKIERICIVPNNKDICIVKYYFIPEFFVEYDTDLMEYMQSASQKDIRKFEDLYKIIGDKSLSIREENLDLG